MPLRFSAQGDEVSPEVEWHLVPEGAESLVLFMYDVSIPADWLRLTSIDHWVVYNISPSLSGLPEGLPDGFEPFEGVSQGVRWGGDYDYMGPDPLFGTHLYVFELYALDKILDVEPSDATRKHLTEKMSGSIIAKANYGGKYRKLRL